MLRRALALGGGLILVILIVLGVKGCLDARAHRALSDYSRNVSEIVEVTDHTSKDFFDKLAEPGELSVTEFITEVNADRSAMDNYASRVEDLSAPGDMGHAQSTLELVYELRSSGMDAIADNIRTALGDVGAQKAIETIADQMQKFLASDVLYSTIVSPEIDSVLTENGIEGDEVPPSVFLPEGTAWLDENAVSSAIESVSGVAPGSVSGIHGLGLLGTSVNGTALVPESTTAVSAEETPEVEVEVSNQGESTENGITVSVTVNGGAPLEQTISSIGVGETETAVIALTPTPSGTATLEVDVKPVPGEKITTNNEATYSVEFE